MYDQLEFDLNPASEYLMNIESFIDNDVEWTDLDPFGYCPFLIFKNMDNEKEAHNGKI